MNNFLVKHNLWYRLQQLIILILHFVLLYWMYFTLTHSGMMSTLTVFYHFIGMSILGALLIRGTAYWAQHHYLKAKNNTEDIE
jgi:apolipoprotein N-acyltransferase